MLFSRILQVISGAGPVAFSAIDAPTGYPLDTLASLEGKLPGNDPKVHMLRISIVSPSFNQVSFVQATLDSIVSQNYGNFEHLVFDGGSNDGTADILRDHEKKHSFAKVVIEADKGQTDAINKGFFAATGDVVTWLNTDDRYVSNDVLSKVAEAFARFPDADVVYGRGAFVDPDGVKIRDAFIHTDADQLRHHFMSSVGILQPALFFRRALFEKFGPLDIAMACAFDYEYWTRLAAGGCKFVHLPLDMVEATFHKDAKSTALRRRQLMESAQVCERHYGFHSAEWLSRWADNALYQVNGIVDAAGVIKEERQTLLDQVSQLVFDKFNRDNASRLALAGAPSVKAAGKSVAMAARCGLVRRDFAIATTFNEPYLNQGLTLIASVHRLHGGMVPIIVFDLGLEPASRSRLENLENVHVRDYPEYAVNSYPEFLNPKGYGYKCVAMAEALALVREGTRLLWIDAGVAPIKALDPIIAKIEKDGAFFVDHDDRPTWPFYNGTFTHPAAIKALETTPAELFAPHLCSCLFGVEKGHRLQAVFDEAARYSLNKDAVFWDKHPPESPSRPGEICKRPPATMAARRLAGDPRALAGTSIEKAIEVLGYQGHRQDQTVLSILAARYRAPLSSAKAFCMSTDLSSEASKLNWQSGGVHSSIKASSEIPPEARHAVTFHHRNTYKDISGLRPASKAARTFVVLGNGPSLKGFDFSRLDGFDSVGMNAAYRFWDEIGWYPTYYICLDTVVGLSHKDEIARLIRERSKNGIRAFMLRRNLIDAFPEDIATLNCVLDFDELKAQSGLFDAEPITTGSHSLLFGALLGYSRILALGVDINYVERIQGAQHLGGTKLQLKETPASNPNYFFDSYQQAGDRYNIPNPTPDLHLTAWRNVAAVLKNLGIKAWNGSPVSNMDALEKRSFEEVEAEETPRKALEHGRAAHAHVDETAVVAHMLRQSTGLSNIMIDVGAHFGGSALFFDKLGWRIYCFEPDAKNRERLVKRFGTNPNVSIDTRAVSDKEDEGVPFYNSDESTGISGLNNFRETHREVARVAVTTVAKVAEQHKIERVRFLKIDVEGFDLYVLRGVPWDKIKPDVIECEFEDLKTVRLGHTYKDAANFLQSKGYAVYISEWHPIQAYGRDHDWRRVFRYPGPELAGDAWGNIVAFIEDPGEEAVTEAFRACIGYRKPKPPIAAPAASLTATVASAALNGSAAQLLSDLTAKFTQIKLSLDETLVRFKEAPQTICADDFSRDGEGWTLDWQGLPGEPLEANRFISFQKSDRGKALRCSGRLAIISQQHSYKVRGDRILEISHTGRSVKAASGAKTPAVVLLIARAFDAEGKYVGPVSIGEHELGSDWRSKTFRFDPAIIGERLPAAKRFRISASMNWVPHKDDRSGDGVSESLQLQARWRRKQ